ncbi:MAG TPA: hypothetical protein PKD74_00015 [Candidatus Dependentiae bacterium]|nr:hypothetical protein [Candidatus Dependentiae bacterium]
MELIFTVILYFLLCVALQNSAWFVVTCEYVILPNKKAAPYNIIKIGEHAYNRLFKEMATIDSVVIHM